MQKERKDIRDLEGAYEYVENYVTDNLKRNYSYNGIVSENLLKQVQKELEFIKETKTAGGILLRKPSYKIFYRQGHF